MKKLFALLIVSLISLSACQNEEQHITKKARAIHEQVITIDTHDDISTSNFTNGRNYTQDLDTQVNLPKMEEGGLDVSWLVVYTGQDDLTDEGYAKAYKNADEKFKAIHRLAEEYAPDKIELAYTAEDVRRIVEEGKKVAMIGVENGYPIGEDLSKVEEFYNRGARYMSLSHNGHSQLADSNTGEEDDEWKYNGLSELGRKVIKEMNRLGIMVDLSHPSKESNLETIKLSKAPVIASHSSARAVNDVSRNLSNEELEALKENGGVVQTVAFSSYIDSKKDKKHQDAAKDIINQVADSMDFKILSWDEVGKMNKKDRESYLSTYREVRKKAQPRIKEDVNEEAPPVNVADFVDHIDYIVDKIGINHVGISSDFDGGGGVEGWNDASETFNVTKELVKRDYSENEIRKLWGGNLLRVLNEVQAVAQKLQSEKG